MTIARILTIAGSDSGGGAGIQADLKTITALGGYGLSVITALTAQNTLGVHGVHAVPVDFITQQFRTVMSDIGADAVKTGMLGTIPVIETVAALLREAGRPPLVVDPVMVAKGGAVLLAPEAKHALVRELLPLALVVTPNLPEAEALCGIKIRNPDDMRAAAAAIHGLGPAYVVVKGGHLAGGDALDILFDGKTCHEFTAPRLDTKNTHGTGCTFSAALATLLGQGKPLRESVAGAKRFVTRAIRHACPLGGGHGPVNHGYIFQEIGKG